MSKVVYEIVEHDGGFAYRVGDVFSETFPTYQAAHAAAERAAQRQQVAGQDEQIQYQDAQAIGTRSSRRETGAPRRRWTIPRRMRVKRTRVSTDLSRRTW